jgi:hypothetical protein
VLGVAPVPSVSSVPYRGAESTGSSTRERPSWVADDNEKIYVTWKGIRHGPKEVIDRVNRGETVDPGTYYFRTTPYFETGSQKYAWLNRICSIATGSRNASGRTIQVFQVL